MIIWETEGQKSTPASGTVLADTGAMEANEGRGVIVWVSSAVAASVRLVKRNAANDADMVSHTWNMTTASPVVMLPFNISMGEDERLRIVTDGLVLGAIQGSIHTS